MSFLIYNQCRTFIMHCVSNTDMTCLSVCLPLDIIEEIVDDNLQDDLSRCDELNTIIFD